MTVTDEDSFYQKFGSMEPAMLVENGCYTECNDAALTLLGIMSKEELVNCQPYEFAPTSQVGSQSKGTIEPRHESGSRQCEWQFFLRHGGVISVDVRLSHHQFANKKITLGLLKKTNENQRALKGIEQSDKQLRAFHEASLDGWMILGQSGFIDCNPAAVTMCGVSSREELLKLSPVDISTSKQPCGQSSKELAKAHVQQAMEDGNHRVDWVFERGDSHTAFYADILLTGMVLNGESVVQVNMRDVTARQKVRQHEQLCHQILTYISSDKSLSDILEAVALGVEVNYPSVFCSILLLDEKSSYLSDCVAPSLPKSYQQTIVGVEVGPYVGTTGAAIYTKDAVLTNDLKNDKGWVNYQEDAKEFGMVGCWSQPVFSPTNAVIAALTLYFKTPNAVSNDDMAHLEQVAQLVGIAIIRKRLEEQMNQLVFQDGLTGLANRRTMENLLQHAVTSNIRTGKRGAILFIDLDNFKSINDALGHAQGDILLQQVGQRLTACIREGDTVARFGGDEFVLLLENLKDEEQLALKQAEIVGGKTLEALRQPFQLANVECYSLASIGIVIFDGHEPAKKILQQADLAMYQVKRAGRNAIRFFDPNMQRLITSREELKQELQRALKNNQFQLYFQALVDHQDNLVGAEVTVCWEHPTEGVLKWDSFSDAAYEAGLMQNICHWAIREICRQLRQWQCHEQTKGLTLSIKVDDKIFENDQFTKQISAALNLDSLDARLLKIDIMESVLSKNRATSYKIMTELKEIGVAVSLTNFGVGYSSIKDLKEFSIERIKIDPIFVNTPPIDDNEEAVLCAFISMAKSLDIGVAVAGIQTKKQQEWLSKLGFEYFQGDYLAKPQPPVEFLEQAGL